MKIKTSILLGVALVFLGSVVFASLANAQGLVPCGKGGNDPCTLCYLIVGFKDIVDWGLRIVFVLAMFVITLSGVIYAISSGSSELTKQAKGALTASIVGFAITLCAWLIVNTVMQVLAAKGDLGVGATNWYTFNCDKSSSALQGGTNNQASMATCNNWCDTSGYSGDQLKNCKQGCAEQALQNSNTDTKKSACESWCDNSGYSGDQLNSCKSGCGEITMMPSGTTASDAAARKQLADAGINVTSTGNCSDRNNAKCTSLDGMPQNTVDGLTKLKESYGGPVTVTGGTETGHQSHGVGQSAVDLKWDENLAGKIMSNPSAYGVTKMCSADPRYSYNCGNFTEPNPHIHLAF